MNRNFTTAYALLLAAMLFPTASSAQPFDLSWYTLDGGGEILGAGGSFELAGTIAQYDASTPMSGGTFEIIGGFWAGIDPIPCPPDLNGDDVVDLTDLSQLLSNFGTLVGASHSEGDTDGDADVDLADLSFLLSNFGLSCT